jgi:hypothetical protein
MKKIGKISFITIFLGFTLLTLFLSTSVIFDWFGVRAKEGNYVLFVVIANFICSLLYVVSIIALLKHKKWAYHPLGLALIILIAAQFGLHRHIEAGGIYETKTVFALYFRMTLTAIFGIITYLLIKKK